jgi:hypothetical protein
MDDVVELIVVIQTSPRSSKMESGCKSYRCFRIARSSWADYLAHFWKYPAKYPALNLNDVRLAIFWSLADFRGDRNIRPTFGNIRPNIRPHIWMTRVKSLAVLGGGGRAEYPVQTWTGISSPAVQQRLHSWEGYKYTSPSSSLG